MSPRFICGCYCHDSGKTDACVYFNDACVYCKPAHNLHREHIRDDRVIKHVRAGG